jgi:uncharacterized protein (TIGR03083 family)
MTRTMLTSDTKLTSELTHTEQSEFVDLVRGFTAQSWSRPSLCAGWTVRDVVVHAAAHIHGEQKNATVIAQYTAGADEDLIAWLAAPPNESTARSLRARRFTAQIQRGELMIHQQDVRRALDLPREIAADQLIEVLEFGLGRVAGILLALNRQRSTGLRLVATDSDWTWGRGQEVRGSLEAILMATAGRGAVLSDLQGPGVALLADRISAPPFVVRKVMAVARSTSA